MFVSGSREDRPGEADRNHQGTSEYRFCLLEPRCLTSYQQIDEDYRCWKDNPDHAFSQEGKRTGSVKAQISRRPRAGTLHTTQEEIDCPGYEGGQEDVRYDNTGEQERSDTGSHHQAG